MQSSKIHFMALLGSIIRRLEGFLTECQSENSFENVKALNPRILTKCQTDP